MSLDPSITSANAISGEKTVRTVTYPLTGDPELDALSGILWVIESAQLSGTAAVRILNYLAERYKVMANPALSTQWATQAAQAVANLPAWLTHDGTGPLTSYEVLKALGQQNYQPTPPTSPP